MNESILEPVKSYFGEYRDKFQQLAEQYFDELVKQSGISPEENAAIVAERNKAVAAFNAADAINRRNKGLRAFLIVMSVLLVVAGVVTCALLWTDVLQWVGILVAALCVAGAGALIAVVCTVLNKRIKEGSLVADGHKKQIEDAERRAWQQMLPLNAKYDWNIPNKLIYETTPQILLDKYFDEDKLDYFDKRCNLAAYDENSSALCVKSGNSNGRPFLLTRFLRQSMQARTYTGTRVVTWTETVRDSNGHTRTVTCSETLIASVVKPAPVYFPVTYLFYGCDVATELHFRRSPTVPHNADDKKIDSLVKKGEKALEKKAREAVSDGRDFNKLANSEFEVLFGADDRDNEVQFRLMFTPLAQRNMVELLRSREPYGDDFDFGKYGAVNVISSEHGARLAIEADPAEFVNFDLAKAREHFVDFNCEYFQSVYFDFAPLFCIPLYTQDAPDNKFGECTSHGNIGSWEAEAVANRFDRRKLAPPEAATECILKAETTVGEEFTSVRVTAHSFKAIPQIEYVPRICRNGYTYEVPVPWTLYVPVEQDSNLEMRALDVSREEFDRTDGDDALFVAGIKAKILQDGE